MDYPAPLVYILHGRLLMIRRFLLLSSIFFAAGCGNTWIGQTSEAREQPRLDAIDVTTVPPNTLTLPNEGRSIKFAVIGDSGRGWPPQHQVAAQMVAYRQRFDYQFVLMAGDNIYEGPATPEDYRLKFEEPYKLLLDAGVKFYAVLGNHDDPNQVFYKPFNMDGDRYYTFTPPVDPSRGGIRGCGSSRSTAPTSMASRCNGSSMKWRSRAPSGRSPAASPAVYTGTLYPGVPRYPFRARIIVRHRRHRRGVLRPRASLRALGTSERRAVFH